MQSLSPKDLHTHHIVSANQTNQNEKTSSTSRDPTAEKVTRFVLAIFAVLLGGIPFLHEGFRKYIFEGPEKKSVVDQKIDNVSAKPLSKPAQDKPKIAPDEKPKESSSNSSDIQAQVNAYNLINKKLHSPSFNTVGINLLPEKIEMKGNEKVILQTLNELKTLDLDKELETDPNFIKNIGTDKKAELFFRKNKL